MTNYVANPDIVSEYTYSGLDRTVQYKQNDPTVPVTSYLHDGFGRLQHVQTMRDGVELAGFTYTLGDSGVRKILAEDGLAIPTAGTRTINYAYDGLYRSTAETISGADSGLNGSVGYTHDNVGNRLARTLTSAEATLAAKVPATTSTYTPQDRLEPAANYDLNGNTLIGDVSPAQTQPDVYSFDNRLIQRSTTIDGQAATVVLVYDGDGNRVKKSVTIGASTTTTYFVVDDRSPTGYPQVLEELTPSGAAWDVQCAYTYGDRLLIQHRPEGPAVDQWHFVCHDGHGNTRFLTDLDGNITDTYTYDAFGILVAFSAEAPSGPTPNNYLYAGEQFDPDLGLYYLRARYYNPFTGRFWTRDAFEGNPQVDPPLAAFPHLIFKASRPSLEFALKTVCAKGRLWGEPVPFDANDNWFMDTELLLVAEKNGYRIIDIPVWWKDDPDSRVNLWSTALEDVKGLIRLRRTLNKLNVSDSQRVAAATSRARTPEMAMSERDL